MNATFRREIKTPADMGLAEQASAEQRMARRYYFSDPNMDLFFMSALSWGPAGGLEVGQAWHIAGRIVDGDADSWVHAFADFGEQQNKQADTWATRGWTRAAGEARLKAFAAWRSAWQFAEAGSHTFIALYNSHRRAFAKAMIELSLPVQFFRMPYEGKTLPGLFLRHPAPSAPVVLIVGGADTCHEDLFLSTGRALWDRGYSVALIDLPGQGDTPCENLHWPTEPERATSAVIDMLIAKFGASAGRIALMGLSLGGYFVTRAAMTELRLATVIASTPFPRPWELFSLSIEAQTKIVKPATALLRSRRMFCWKAGVDTPEQIEQRWRDAYADPEAVTVPFLSVVGLGDSHVFTSQAFSWHNRLASYRKELVLLDAATGADAHCQVNSRLRLVQEACGWMDDIFASSQ